MLSNSKFSMSLICICKLRIRLDFYIGETAEPKYLMVSDPRTMKKDRLHTYIDYWQNTY